jgi:hypothetical protein
MSQTEVKTEETVVRKVRPFNDYLAVMIARPSKTLVIQEPEKTRRASEGYVVGIGPDVPAAQAISLGDKVMVRGSTYEALKPEEGGYKDRTIIMVHKADLVLKMNKTDKDEVIRFED